MMLSWTPRVGSYTVALHYQVLVEDRYDPVLPMFWLLTRSHRKVIFNFRYYYTHVCRTCACTVQRPAVIAIGAHAVGSTRVLATPPPGRITARCGALPRFTAHLLSSMNTSASDAAAHVLLRPRVDTIFPTNQIALSG